MISGKLRISRRPIRLDWLESTYPHLFLKYFLTSIYAFKLVSICNCTKMKKTFVSWITYSNIWLTRISYTDSKWLKCDGHMYTHVGSWNEKDVIMLKLELQGNFELPHWVKWDLAWYVWCSYICTWYKCMYVFSKGKNILYNFFEI